MFSWSSFKQLFSFGSNIMFSNLLHTLYINMYSLVIGKLFTPALLGYYNRAYTLSQFPVQNFGNVVSTVLYPVLCGCQDDKEQFNRIFSSYLRLSSFIIFPFMLMLVVLAEPVISVLLTDKWLPAVPMFRIICLALMWLPIMQMNVSVMDAKGNSKYHLHSELIKKVLAVLILVGSIPFGMNGICWGMLVYSFADMAVVIAYSRKLTGIGYREHFRLVFPLFMFAVLMAAAVYLAVFTIASHVWQLCVGVAVGVVIYLLLAILFKVPEWQYIRTNYLTLKKKQNR
jgi:O-antigen/teichoic acid export membrane protein